MVRTAGVDRIEQEVEIDEYHALFPALQFSRRLLVLENSGQAEGFVEIDSGRRPAQVERGTTVPPGPSGRSRVHPTSQHPIQELFERHTPTVCLIAQAFQQALVNIYGSSHV
jgi:hypothetical protein